MRVSLQAFLNGRYVKPHPHRHRPRSCRISGDSYAVHAHLFGELLLPSVPAEQILSRLDECFVSFRLRHADNLAKPNANGNPIKTLGYEKGLTGDRPAFIVSAQQEEAMTDLIERLKAAEAGSNELNDWVVIRATEGEMMDWWDEKAQQHIIKAGDGSRVNVTPVTTSIDTAVALAALVLPDFWWLARSDETAGAMANIGPENDGKFKGETSWPTFAKTAPLALCASILSALEARK
jgi:hypothetical protein